MTYSRIINGGGREEDANTGSAPRAITDGAMALLPRNARVWNPPPRISSGIRSPLLSPGGKARIAPWLVSLMCLHKHYLEPFVGSGAVLVEKPRVAHEVVNDLSGTIVKFLRAAHDHPEALALALYKTPYARDELMYAWATPQSNDPIETARRTAVLSRQSIGAENLTTREPRFRAAYAKTANPAAVWAGIHNRVRPFSERLRGVQIENRDAVTLIRSYRGKDALIYADPPYLHTTRRATDLYEHEMTYAEHVELLKALMDHAGPVLLSGYPSQLYNEQLTGWHCVYRKGFSQRGARAKVEVVWLNEEAYRRGPLSGGASVYDTPGKGDGANVA